MPRYDWDALKAEWLQSGETLNQFRQKKGIENTNIFYAKVKEMQWEKDKQKINARALAKLRTRKSNELAEEWAEFGRAHSLLLKNILKRLQDSVSGDEIVKPLKAHEIRQFVSAIKELGQAESFIRGGPTDRTETKNLHADLMDVINDVTESSTSISE